MVDLRENERKTLLALKEAGGRMILNDIVQSTGLDHAATMRAALSLESEKLVEITEKKKTNALLTEEGKRYAQKGLPERLLAKSLRDMGGEAGIEEALESISLDGNLKVIALGWLSRKGWAKIDNKQQKLKLLKEPAEGADEKLIALLKDKQAAVVEELGKELRDAVYTLKKRNIVHIQDRTERELGLTDAGWSLIKKGIEATEEVSQITPDLIATGKWRKVELRAYNIKAPVAHVWPGKKHPYLKFLDELKRKLVALGFKEMAGPMVELSFFNCDALFMPQDHPAREIHDMYFIKQPEYGSLDCYKTFLRNMGETHQNGWKTGSKGWGYAFSALEAARLVLRSHTTANSARELISEKLEIPGKYFAISRCFRPDVIDSTHLPEFNQVEGIILGENLTLLDLLGVLKKFAVEIAGAEKVRYRPDYYPFTEPSVELGAYKKDMGWMEFGGSGIFRPEVTLPLGVEVPVLAWGLGVDRLFMMKAGIDDIRYLFSQDLDWMRRMEMV